MIFKWIYACFFVLMLSVLIGGKSIQAAPNNQLVGTVTFVNVVTTGHGGTATPNSWVFNISNGPQGVLHNQSVTLPIGQYQVTEQGPAGYAVASASGACSLVNGTINLTVSSEGGICTIVNDDLPANLTIIKSATPADNTPFPFTSNIAGGSNFSLQSPADDTIAFLGIAAGQYTITELMPSGWALAQVDCGSAATVTQTNGIKVTVNNGQSVVCTFHNVIAEGTIIFNKVVAGPDPISPTAFSFNVVGGPQNIAHGGKRTLPFGTYTVTENEPAGATLVNASGVCSLVNGSIRLNVALGGGTCTITNAYEEPIPEATITFVTTVINNHGGTATPADWDLTVEGTAKEIDLNNQITLPVGGYTVSASGPASYRLVTATGACQVVNGIIQLTVNNTGGTCTITYNDRPATLTIVKSASPANNTSFTFVSNIPNSSLFSLQDPADNSQTFTNLAAGQYTITEQVPQDWILDSISCTQATFNRNGNTLAVTLSLADNVTCTFQNRHNPPPTATFTPTPLPATPTVTFTPTPTLTPTPPPATPTPTLTPTPQPATSTPTPETTPQPKRIQTVYVSPSSNGCINGLCFRDEDVLAYDLSTLTWSLFFDGSDVGLHPNDLTALHVLDNGTNLPTLLMSFAIDQHLAGFGQIQRHNIIEFRPTSLGEDTAGTFHTYFTGRDFGLNIDGERVDAIAFTPDNRLLLSTIASFQIPGSASTVVGRDEDMIALSQDSTWELYFDGSVVSMVNRSEDISDIWIDPDSGDIYLTTLYHFHVDGLSGTGGDIFVCKPVELGENKTKCTFQPFWVGAEHGYQHEVVDAFSLSYHHFPRLPEDDDPTATDGTTSPDAINEDPDEGNQDNQQTDPAANDPVEESDATDSQTPPSNSNTDDQVTDPPPSNENEEDTNESTDSGNDSTDENSNESAEEPVPDDEASEADTDVDEDDGSREIDDIAIDFDDDDPLAQIDSTYYQYFLPLIVR